jgi:hypothetical protein
MVLIAFVLGVSLLTSALVAGLGLALRKSVIARILVVSLLTSALVAGFLLALLRPDPHSPDNAVILFLACVGAIIGSVAGATREIVSAQRQKASHWADTE